MRNCNICLITAFSGLPISHLSFGQKASSAPIGRNKLSEYTLFYNKSLSGVDFTSKASRTINFTDHTSPTNNIFHKKRDDLNLPFFMNDELIGDFGINFGVSLPIGTVSGAEIGFKRNRLGSFQIGVIQEYNYKISFSIGFNDQSYGCYRKQRKLN